MLKIFMDTEFTSLTQNAELISIALVAETGEEFYMEITNFNEDKKIEISDWVTLNVINYLFLNDKNTNYDLKKMYIKDKKEFLKPSLNLWLNQFGTKKNKDENIEPSIQIWADVPHYDWVLFCEIFNGARNIPKQIHYMPMDLATFLYAKNKDINKERKEFIENNKIPEGKQHNALYDAKITLNCYKSLLPKFN